MKHRKTIKRKLPPVGTNLVHFFYRKPIHKAKIVKDPASPTGKAIEYKGKLYPSMTASAVAISKISVNGWVFWKIV